VEEISQEFKKLTLLYQILKKFHYQNKETGSDVEKLSLPFQETVSIIYDVEEISPTNSRNWLYHI
jgi:hypothetical protein